MRVCLFEDGGVDALEPLTLTRPVFDLLCGQTSLRTKQCRYFAPCEVGVLVRSHLADLYRLQHPGVPVNDLAWLRAERTMVVNGRWLPPTDCLTDCSGPCVALVNDEVAYAILGSEHLTYCSPNTLEDCLHTWKNTLPHHAAGGRLFRYLWEMVDHNGEQLCSDFQGSSKTGIKEASLTVVGPLERVLVDPTALLDPMVVVDATSGPVVIDREAKVTAFSRLEGPCYIGPGVQVLGAKIRAGTTLGPQCRVGGEVEASILQGHSNKYHDGFLGHSYVGEWVNLGAGTHNSDLRNDYGPVRVTVNGRVTDTGMSKVGCFLGDHTKTGLGALLNTGSSVGIFCNLLPSGRLLPKHIPSFCSWWNGSLRENNDLWQLLQTAGEVMRRRGQVLSEVHAALYAQLFDLTAAPRRRTIMDKESLRLRRSA